MLDSVGQIIDRMSELKGLAVSDPLKSDEDIESIQDNDKKESVENDDNKNLNMDLENNSVSN